jgi:ACS family hexuronate transporter-like MFS transporter
MNWRYLFLLSGILGFIWLFFWLRITGNIPPKPKTSEMKPPVKKRNVLHDLPGLLKNKEARTFIFIRFLLDPIFYFYMFWIPKYLNEVKGASLDYIGDYLWIPFLALGIANMMGGWLSDLLFKIKEDVNFARKANMGIASLLTLPVLFAGVINSPALIIFVMSLAFFAHGVWITNYITAIGDIFGKEKSSTVVGLSGSAGAVSSLIINPLIGLVIASFTYKPLWIYSGIMYPVAFFIFMLCLPDMNRKLAK